MIKTFQSSRFDRTPVYTCRSCKKQTRETGHDESTVQLCAFCFREAELTNSLSDGAITEEQFDEAFIELEREYKRGAFAKTQTTFSAPENDDTLKSTRVAKTATKKSSAPSQAPNAKNARRIIRNYLRIATEVVAAFNDRESYTDEEIDILISAMDVADAALSTLPGYHKEA
jgi:hypothetical protein